MIEVEESEYQINMPSSIAAGPVIFRVTNNGEQEHNFEVEGQGIEEEFETNLLPGETRDLELNLQPGTYEVYCPVENHAEEGMRLELTVTEGS